MENQNESLQTLSQSTSPQPSNLPSPPLPENKPHSSFLTNKLFLITIAIVILFAIAYSGIYLSLNSQLNQITKSNPTPTTSSSASPATSDAVAETVNWKTYTTSGYRAKYTFKYPPNWRLEKPLEGSGDIFILDTNQKIRMVIIGLETKLSATPENLANELVIQSKEVISKKKVGNSIFLETESLDNRRVYVFVPDVHGINMSGINKGSPTSNVENVKGILWITLYIDDVKVFTEKMREEFNQILSTFQFSQ